jgi:acetyl-CoA carboxylase biotin carboxyl carrier protein
MSAKVKKPVLSRSSSSRSSTPLTWGMRVEEIAEVMRRFELNEVEVEGGGTRVYLRRGGGSDAILHATHAAGPVAHPVHTPASPTGGGSPSTDTSDGNVAYVTSPFVGTFYRAPSPDMSPFVDVGTRIKKGQVLCIVEAMKLMNEIESEIEGSIVQMLVENGQAVEYGEPLFKIKVG